MRGNLRILRQIIIAGTCALVVALAASRVNRVLPADVTFRMEGLDEVLPDVQIDRRSVRGAIESIRRVAKTPITVEAEAMLDSEKDAKENVRPSVPPLRLKQVHLRAALSAALEEAPPSYRLCLWEENGVVRIGRQAASGGNLRGRLYDVRKILQDYHPTERKFHVRREQDFELFFGGLVSSDTPGRHMHAWNGWLFVYDFPEQQQRTKDLLSLLRQLSAEGQRRATP